MENKVWKTKYRKQVASFQEWGFVFRKWGFILDSGTIGGIVHFRVFRGLVCEK